MVRLTRSLLVASLVAACGGGSADSRSDAGGGGSVGKGDDLEPCALLTSEEIQEVAGWAPDTSDADTYGTTKTCAYHGPDALKQSVVLVVARPAPKVSTSAELAKRRNQQAQRDPSIKMVITPVEGLGVPAVRSEVEGSTTPTIEAVVGNRLLGVTASNFETAKALAAKAAPRLR
jgi:hypothetical protein